LSLIINRVKFKKIKNKKFKGGRTSIFVVNFLTLFLFIFNTSTIIAYIFTALTCKVVIIIFEPCALNANFQHFILRFNKFPYILNTLKRRVWGEKRPKDMVSLQIILIFTLTLTHPKTFI